jgi:hypothetical protein
MYASIRLSATLVSLTVLRTAILIVRADGVLRPAGVGGVTGWVVDAGTVVAVDVRVAIVIEAVIADFHRRRFAARGEEWGDLVEVDGECTINGPPPFVSAFVKVGPAATIKLPDDFTVSVRHQRAAAAALG